jgi:predicted nucleic acid-binding protein
MKPAFTTGFRARMRTNFPVILDANVLAPALVCDLYLRLAEEPRLYSPLWTPDILNEVHRTQIGKLGWPENLADYWRDQVTQAFPEALVTGYEDLISACANDEKDRHVLAAALKASASTIVTFNLKDFPPAAMEPLSIVPRHPSDFLIDLYDLDAAAVSAKIFDIAQSRNKSIEDVLRRLSLPLPRFTAYFAERQALTI